MKRFCQTGYLAVVISLLLTSVIWLGPASAATAPQITWLNELSGGSLASPRAIDVDGQGNLYVADQLARAVLKIDRYGRQVNSFLDGRANGKGVAVTPDGQTLYISTKSQGVAIVNVAAGTVSGYLSGTDLAAPAEIDLDADGYIFVVDQFNIKIFFPNGTFKSAFGGAGKAAGQFTNIAAMTVNPVAARVYVANGEAAVPRMQVFDTAGVLLSNVTNASLYGTDNHSARGIAFEENVGGRAYVLRYLPAALRVFDGSFAPLLGDFGSVSGKLTAPVDAIFDPTSNRLFVSDGSGVDVFGIDGGSAPAQVNHAPGVPVPTSPTAGTVVTSVSPVLSWTASTDADGDALTYDVVVKQEASSVYTATTAANSLTIPAGILAENSSYTWSVQAYDGQATSAFSAASAFVVNAVDEPPSAPVTVSPLAGEVMVDASALVWQASVDPDPSDTQLNYRVEVATDAAFADMVITDSLAGTSVLLSALPGNADLAVGASYFWRVTALDGDGTASPPSATGSFVYDADILRVTANVADATVSLHGNHGFAGQVVGVTPVDVRNLAAGRYAVVVERAGFEPYITQVTLTAGASAVVNASLVPAYKSATFTAGYINGAAGIAVGANAAPVLVDFDSDGLLDLLVGDAAGQISVFPAMSLVSNYKLAFQSGYRLTLPVLPGAAPFVADWNNDGLKDLLVGLSDGTVKLFVNAGSELAPDFDGGQDLTVGGSVLSVTAGASPAVVDLNGDGAKDLVVGSASGKVYLFLNQGSDAAPQLAAGATLLEVTGAAQVTPVDWDADGDRDLLVTSSGQTVAYLNEAAAFAAADALPVAGAFGVAAVDVNNLYGKDLIVGQLDGKLAYRASTAQDYADSTLAYLLAAWDELALLVAGENPAALAQADQVAADLAAGRYNAAKNKVEKVARELGAGETATAVTAFAELLK